MPAHRRPTPSYLHHGSSDRARAVWTDGRGCRLFRLLPGKYGSAESRAAYARLLLELDVAPNHAELAGRADLAVAEVLDAYRVFAITHYRQPDGRLSSTIHEVRIVAWALGDLYGDMLAREFGPLCVQSAMQQWVVAGCCRTEGNRRLGVVKRIMRWAASEELVPPSIYHGLTVVSGLKVGRTTARETDPVRPVDDAMVDVALPHLNRHVGGLVEFQRLTGCRPGEASGRVSNRKREGRVDRLKFSRDSKGGTPSASNQQQHTHVATSFLQLKELAMTDKRRAPAVRL